jgi:hypothetical protein
MVQPSSTASPTRLQRCSDAELTARPRRRKIYDEKGLHYEVYSSSSSGWSCISWESCQPIAHTFSRR